MAAPILAMVLIVICISNTLRLVKMLQELPRLSTDIALLEKKKKIVKNCQKLSNCPKLFQITCFNQWLVVCSRQWKWQCNTLHSIALKWLVLCSKIKKS